jgi:Ca2+-transporting ATPase
LDKAYEAKGEPEVFLAERSARGADDPETERVVTVRESALWALSFVVLGPTDPKCFLITLGWRAMAGRLDHMQQVSIESEHRNRAWHAKPWQEVMASLGSDQGSGLSADEASARLVTYGPNELQHERSWPRLRRLGRQFADLLVWLLLIAAATSGFVLGAWVDAMAVAGIVVVNAVLGYVQEARAEGALEHLKSVQSPTARLIREGRYTEVAASEVVPGDIMVIDAGDVLAADGRIVENVRLEVAEASLTGESMPVEKTIDPVATNASVADRTSMVYSGTTVVRGRGRALVTATGAATEVGSIAASVADAPPPTPLQLELDRIGRRLAFVALAAGVLVFGAGLLQQYPLETMILTAVAMAVAAIPEGLPAVVTVTLAGGLRHMADQGAIVRRLPAVEALGAVDVICTDKTGTLTRGVLAVVRVSTPAGTPDDHEAKRILGGDRRLLETAALCNDVRHTGAGYVGDPVEVALMEAAVSSGLDPESLHAEHPRVDEAGFDARRKRMSTLNRSNDGYVLHVKGAPEVVLARSNRMLTDRGVAPIDEDRRRDLEAEAEQMARDGLRALAFAFRPVDDRPDNPIDVESDLVYLGLVGLSDELRPEVPASVEGAAQAGVRTVMVTGDHLTTARSVAKEVGIDGRAMHGSRLRTISDEELADEIDEYAVFARVDPVDKVKIVHAWRGAGSTVAMTGDGVNDAPALNSADIGVAMGSGTDVSRESAALVLTDDNYATIVNAIAEGRRIFHNLRNVVHYLLSANTSEVLYMVIGFVFFGYLGEPLIAVQLLWINLLSDALPALALGMDFPSRDLMRDAPRSGRDILSPRNIAVLVVQGATLAAASLLVLLLGHFVMELAYPEVRTMVFSTLVLAQLLHAVNVRANDRHVSWPRAPLLGAIGLSFLLQLLIIYTGFGQRTFQIVALSPVALLLVLGASALSMVAVRALTRVMRTRD